jgi:hypothetical protein
MIPDQAVWCTARALVALSCDDDRVLRRAHAHLSDGNLEKYVAWMRVLCAVNALRRGGAGV